MKITKIAASAAVVSCLALTACGGGSGAADGQTATGTSQGKGGEITVTLAKASDGTITVSEIKGDNETQGIGGYEAIQDGTYKAQIEKAQGSDIEGVSGATITTDGVKAAVDDALSQLK